MDISLILSGLSCIYDFVFKRKVDKDNEFFYHRYMYISGAIVAVTLAFLVGFGVVPFATVTPLAGPFICVSFCFFLYRLVCFIRNYLQKTHIEIPNQNGQNMSGKIENSHTKEIIEGKTMNSEIKKKQRRK